VTARTHDAVQVRLVQVRLHGALDGAPSLIPLESWPRARPPPGDVGFNVRDDRPFGGTVSRVNVRDGQAAFFFLDAGARNCLTKMRSTQVDSGL
jgi:hypothetical protein